MALERTPLLLTQMSLETQRPQVVDIPSISLWSSNLSRAQTLQGPLWATLKFLHFYKYFILEEVQVEKENFLWDISSSVTPFSCLHFPSIRGFSNELALRIGWPKHCSFSFSVSPTKEYVGLISFKMDWFDLLAVQGTLKSLLQYHLLKGSIFWHSAFVMVQLSRPYMTTGKTIALARWTFVTKVVSLLFNMHAFRYFLLKLSPSWPNHPHCYQIFLKMIPRRNLIPLETLTDRNFRARDDLIISL